MRARRTRSDRAPLRAVRQRLPVLVSYCALSRASSASVAWVPEALKPGSRARLAGAERLTEKNDVTKVRTTGLVVGTTDPVDNKLRLGNRNRGWVRVIADAGGSRVNAVGRFDLTKNRWLVVGMEIPVMVDPDKPGGFEIDWEAIPSMEQRVAANDPTLADPIGAQKRAREALLAVNGAAGNPADATAERFKQAMRYSAEQPAPAGKTRAIVHVAAITTTIRTADYSTEHQISKKQVSTGNRRAVLSVNVPGQAPYAVLRRRFKRPRGMAGLIVPALVSSSDPTDVDVLWDELASMRQLA
jgi:hypothetical protein